MRSIAATALTVVLLAATAACGSSERPTSSDIVDVLASDENLMGQAFEGEQAECFADLLTDSDLSDATLRALVEGDDDYEGSDEEAEILTEIGTQFSADCL